MVLALGIAAGCGHENEFYDLPPQLLAPRILLSTPEDVQLTIDVAAMDAHGGALSYTATAPRHGVVSGAGPRFHYSPTQNYAGSDGLSVVISDGNSALAVAVEITVTPVDDTPVAIDVQASTSEDEAITVVLAATDVDTSALAYRLVAPPAHGTLSGVAPSFSYTPSAHYAGADSFTYAVSDATQLSNVATATITITDVVACGDGITEGNEQCDDGNAVDSDGCNTLCRRPSCGDDLVQLDRGEQCDDGNITGGDGCDAACIAEPFAAVELRGEL